MRTTERPPLPKVRAGDLSRRVGNETLEERGVDVEGLCNRLADAARAELAMYYRYTVLGMYLAGRGEYRRACDAARLGHQRNFEAVTGRLFELGGSLEDDIQGLGAVVRGDSTDGGNDKSDAPSSHEDRMISVGDALAKLLESERQSIREWSVLCDMTEGKDRRTFGLATRVLDEAIESEACLIEFTSFEREGLTRPSGSFRR